MPTQLYSHPVESVQQFPSLIEISLGVTLLTLTEETDTDGPVEALSELADSVDSDADDDADDEALLLLLLLLLEALLLLLLLLEELLLLLLEELLLLLLLLLLLDDKDELCELEDCELEDSELDGAELDDDELGSSSQHTQGLPIRLQLPP
jgi:hypothetical protein